MLGRWICLAASLAACGGAPVARDECTNGRRDPASVDERARWEMASAMADDLRRELYAERPADCDALNATLDRFTAAHADELRTLAGLRADTSGRFDRWSERQTPPVPDGAAAERITDLLRSGCHVGTASNSTVGLLLIVPTCIRVSSR